MIGARGKRRQANPPAWTPRHCPQTGVDMRAAGAKRALRPCPARMFHESHATSHVSCLRQGLSSVDRMHRYDTSVGEPIEACLERARHAMEVLQHGQAPKASLAISFDSLPQRLAALTLLCWELLAHLSPVKPSGRPIPCVLIVLAPDQVNSHRRFASQSAAGKRRMLPPLTDQARSPEMMAPSSVEVLDCFSSDTGRHHPHPKAAPPGLAGHAW